MGNMMMIHDNPLKFGVPHVQTNDLIFTRANPWLEEQSNLAAPHVLAKIPETMITMSRSNLIKPVKHLPSTWPGKLTLCN